MKTTNEKPMLFSGPMVRAILEGRKTQTRRIVKHPEFFGCFTADCPHKTQDECDAAIKDWAHENAPHPVGSLIWVKETFFAHYCPCGGDEFVRYRADGDKPTCDSCASSLKWKPSIFMPRSASRITLEVEAVRVERLMDITETGCVAEGIQASECWEEISEGRKVLRSPRWAYSRLWEFINGKGSWSANPWVWDYTFKKI